MKQDVREELSDKDSVGLLLAFRSWEPLMLSALRRDKAEFGASQSKQIKT